NYALFPFLFREWEGGFLLSTRKGKPIQTRRTKPIGSSSNSISLTLDDAGDYVYSYKQSEGLRDKTLDDYIRLPNYFRDWLNEFYPEVIDINDVASGMIRHYINHLLNDHYNSHSDSYGLSPVTINIRLRNMSAFFNVLHGEKFINENPMALI